MNNHMLKLFVFELFAHGLIFLVEGTLTIHVKLLEAEQEVNKSTKTGLHVSYINNI